MSGQDIQRQSKRIIYNVYTYLKNLVSSKPNESVGNVLAKTQECAAEACKVSRCTVQRICKEANTSDMSDFQGDNDDRIGELVFSEPLKRIPHVRKVTGFDDFQKDLLKRTIQEFFDRGEYPTCSKIKAVLEEKFNFLGSRRSLNRIIRDIGYRYKKSNDGRRFLMERSDITAARIKFLRKMHNERKRQLPRPIIYLDETWINQNHSRKYIWQDSDSKGGLKVPVGKGSRLIVCHAGSAQHGFLKGAELIFQSKTGNSVDYHQDMNGDLFKEWFVDMLRTLEEGCVVVMDNASYHSMYLEKIPNSKTKKVDIINWLIEKNIPHNALHTVPELLKKVKENKPKYQIYELDVLASKMGHEVIRLPPYCCQYNPIELIWAKVKGEVADKNNTFKMIDVFKLLREALANITVEDWQKCVRHAEHLQEDDFVKEGVRDEEVQRLVINIGGEESDDSSDSDEEML